MQKSWSIATSSGPSVGASTLLCGLTQVDRGRHTRVAHWDNSLVIHANHYCLFSVQHNKLLQVLVLSCNVPCI